jgi:tetratricopeptide (TPR) repeat protein
LSTLGNHLGRHEAALVWARHAEAALDELDDPARASMLAKLRGELYQEMHRYAEAEVDLRAGLALLPADAKPFDRATALSMLGNLLAEQWRCGDAEPLYREALELDTAVFADLQALNGLAVCAIQDKRHADAIALFERGLALVESSNETPEVSAQLLSNLALIYDETGQTALALEKLGEARERSLAAFGPHTDEVRIVEYNLARIHLKAGDIESARWWGERVLEAPPGESLTVRMELQGTWVVKEAHRRAGRLREAIAAWEQRLALREREGDAASWAKDLDDFAELLDEAGRPADATAARGRAAELRATSPASDGPAGA